MSVCKSAMIECQLSRTTAEGVVPSPSIPAPRRRGKSLMRRRGQHGNVFQKGRTKSDEWLPEVPAYVQLWRDVPGQAQCRREKLALGVCRTAQSLSVGRLRNLSSSGSTARSTSSKQLHPSHSRNRAKSGSGPCPQGNATHLNSPRSTTDAMRWTNGFIHSSKAACWPTSTIEL